MHPYGCGQNSLQQGIATTEFVFLMSPQKQICMTFCCLPLEFSMRFIHCFMTTLSNLKGLQNKCQVFPHHTAWKISSGLLNSKGELLTIHMTDNHLA